MGQKLAAAFRSRSVRVALVVATTALVMFPAGVYAAHTFTDVPDTHTFHDDISWLADAGVTQGCTPTQYCPSNPVTRGQMAAFMRRLAENQVVDAATAQTATTATNAAALGGRTADQIASKVESETWESVSSVDAQTTVASVAITVPTAGTIVAQAQGNVVIFGAGTVAQMDISDGSSPTISTDQPGAATAGLLDGDDTIRRRFPLGTTAVFDVAAGTHTFEVRVARSTVFNANAINLTPGTFVVTFTPSVGGGAPGDVVSP